MTVFQPDVFQLNVFQTDQIGAEQIDWDSGADVFVKSLTYVEIDIPAFAQNSPPDSPLIETTMRFAIDTAYLPSSIEAIPSIKDVKIDPQIVSLGQDLGQRSTLTVTFKDHRYVFNGEGYEDGTFWGKFRARHGLKLRGYDCRLIRGLRGQALEEMETRHYLIESTDGPSTNGDFKLIAKDIVKLSDGDRAQAPALSNGFLIAEITDTANEATLSPSGVGDEYPDTGYVAIGGKEIVEYGRGSATKLLILANDGVDGSTVINDDSRYNWTIVLGGNAQFDTAQFLFGSSSIELQGSDDFFRVSNPNNAAQFVMGTGDYFMRGRFRPTSVVGNRIIMEYRGAALGSVLAPMVWMVGTSLRLFFNGSDVITGATAITTNTWHEWELSRVSGSTRLFLDGVQQGSTFADANNYVGVVDRPVLGIIGDLVNNEFVGHMQDVQIVKGVGGHTANFTPSASAAVDTGTITGTDILVLTDRAQFNTEATSHDDGDRVQLVLIYSGEDPADIIADLFQTYAFVPASYITLANWQAETAAFNGRQYSAVIAEPTAVNQLIGELVEQAALAVWPDELTQQIRLQVLRQISTLADVYDEDNTLAGTLEVREQPEKRLSQVWVYFAKINPLVKEDQIENYRSTALVRDEIAEVEYGSASIKKIFSRWIATGGRATAEHLGDSLLSRFVDPPRRFNFELMRYAGQDPQLGGGYQLGGWPFQDVTGAPITIPIQVTRLNPEADRWEVESEEMLFEAQAPSSPDVRIIIFDANANDINLRDIHDGLYADPVSGDTIQVTIQSGVIIGSSSTSTPAFNVGTWPAGVTRNIELKGRIEGRGGNGGGVGHTAGFPGGTALLTTEAINLTWTDGEIWGGGGGGGGSATGGGGEVFGGGGGAGQLPGNGGIPAGTGVAGSPGTTEAGGAGGAVIVTAAGGAPGTAGGNAGLGGGAGGAAGVAIDGDSFITDVGAPGDSQGSEIN